MDKLIFKKEHKDGLYSFLHIDNSSYGSMAALENHIGHPFRKGISDLVYMEAFYNYLALAEFLSEKRNKYCLAAFYPEKNNTGLMEVSNTPWSYGMLSDDKNGLGIDKGFVSSEENLMDEGNSNEQRLYTLESFLSLSRLPEGTLGEAVSQCSLFGIRNERTATLQHALQSAHKPKLEKLLEEDDVFLHIVAAKEIGYYNTILIRSVKDIEVDIHAFQNVLDPRN